MKKSLIITSILSLLIGSAGLSTYAVATDNNMKERGIITVNIDTNTEIAPDVAEIAFTVKTSDTKSMQKATSENKIISDKVYATLKAMINAQNGDYIKTSDFNAVPIYSYSGNKRTLDKYEVSNRVIVHTKSIQNIGKMIDNSIISGATNVDSLNFSVSNYDAQCDELLASASKKAYSRANLLAKSMNSYVTGISSVNSSCSTNNTYRQPRLYMAKNMLADAAGSSQDEGMAISNGVIKLNATVNATFFVK